MKPSVILLVVVLVSTFLRAEPDGSDGYTDAIAVKLLLHTTRTVAGQPITYPETDIPEVTAVEVVIPPGAETGWHKHPYPCFAYILEGELEIEMETGKTAQLQAGQALAESVNVLHNGVNRGTKPAKLVMFVMGEKGKPFTIKEPPATE